MSHHGWCEACYKAGDYTLAVGSGVVLCAFHVRLSGSAPAPPAAEAPAFASVGSPRQRRTLRPPGRAPQRSARRPVSRTRPGAGRVAREYGRRRAARRVDSGRWAPHPGWRNFLPAGAVVLVDQATVLRRVEHLTTAQRWRPDRRAAWTAILRALVCGMSWETGLVTGVTTASLAAAGGRSARTVSDVLRWAREVGLLAVVESGASATFLGSERNRTPSYVFLARPDTHPGPSTAACERTPVDQGLCDLPVSYVEKQPLPGERLDPQPTDHAETDRWPAWGIPQNPAERSAAVRELSRRMGLDRPGVALWRLRAGLAPWFKAGWCPAGLLWAIDHHPDQPEQHRGDALRGATDPIRVLLARLAPWTGRHDQLPAHLHGHPGDYRARHATQLADAITTAEARAHRPGTTAQATHQVTASATHRAALRAQFAARARQRRPTGR